MDQDRQKARELARGLPGKQKLTYYLDYYKIHLAIALALLVSVVMFVRSRLTYQTPLLCFGIMNSEQVDTQKLVQEMRIRLSADDRQTVMVHTGLYTDPELPQTSPLSLDQLAIYLASDELNIMFSDEAGIRFLASSDVLKPVSEWLPPEYQSELDCRIQNFPSDSADSSPEDMPVAIDLSGLPVMDELGLEEKTHYLAVIDKEFPETYLYQFLQYLL